MKAAERARRVEAGPSGGGAPADGKSFWRSPLWRSPIVIYLIVVFASSVILTLASYLAGSYGPLLALLVVVLGPVRGLLKYYVKLAAQAEQEGRLWPWFGNLFSNPRLFRFVTIPFLAVFGLTIFIGLWQGVRHRARREAVEQRRRERIAAVYQRARVQKAAQERERSERVKAEEQRARAETAELEQGRFRGRSASEWIAMLDAETVPPEVFEALDRIGREGPRATRAEMVKALTLFQQTRERRLFISLRINSLLKALTPDARKEDVPLEALDAALTRAESAPESVDLRTLRKEVFRLARDGAGRAPAAARLLTLRLATIEVRLGRDSSALRRCLGYGPRWPETNADRLRYIYVLEKSRTGGRHSRDADRIAATLKAFADEEVGERALRGLILVELETFMAGQGRGDEWRAEESLARLRPWLKARAGRVLALTASLKSERPGSADFFERIEALIQS